MLFAVLLRATALVIAGYFVWFAASRTEDKLRPFGKYLALWTFFFAGLYVLGSLAAPALGYRFGMGRPGMMMHGPMGGGFGGRFGGGMGGMGMRGFMMQRGDGHFMHHHHDGDQNAPAAPSASGSTPSTTTPATPTPGAK